MVNLFVLIICKDGDDYFLVIFVEKVGIKVDDVLFVVVDFDYVEGILIFIINVGDMVVVNVENLICVIFDDNDELLFYVLVCWNLEVLIDCKLFYRLIDLGVERDGIFGIESVGVFFLIMLMEKFG